ncbi:unnamed protein product [Brugia timori]|uniref:Uncharacterized protein n=1 Tax=Brugia timori TaxID=42155 RepID=A0A0R3R7K6_9BILA|nr:unnamed protein product [Brugia timori]
MKEELSAVSVSGCTEILVSSLIVSRIMIVNYHFLFRFFL